MKSSTSSKSEVRRHEIANVKPVRHRHNGHGIHPYFGKVDPALAQHLILKYSQPGDLVLDPFCGSGTVLHEAISNDRLARGWDSSPLAVMIAAAKIAGITGEEARSLNPLLTSIGEYGAKAGMFTRPVPDSAPAIDLARVKSADYWFSSNAFRELAFLKATIESDATLTPVVKLFTEIAFSRIVTAASNQQGESTYRRIEKPDFAGRVIDLYIEAARDVVAAAAEFTAHLNRAGRHRISFTRRNGPVSFAIDYGNTSAEIVQADTRADVGPEMNADVSLVVTSPPYLMSWDYGLYHKFRFYWLGFDLDTYESTEIGRHLRRKKDDAEHYADDLERALRRVNAVLKPGGHIGLVNAPSVVYGQTVDTNALIMECGRKAGLEAVDCVASIRIPGPHHGMYASLNSRNATAPGERGKREHVLIFQKPATHSRR